MTKKHRITFLLVTAVTTVGLVYSAQAKREKDGSKEPKGGSSSSSVQIEQVWELPAELNEISSNVLIDENRMACVQDNDGIVFIYNLKTKSIEQRITFAGKGDYEGLAVVGDTYYVSRGDGFLYEIRTGSKDKPVVTTYDLAFGIENDTEPLFYDRKGNRLLIGTKEKDLSGGDGKGVYSFDLRTKKLSPERVMAISSSYADNKEAANDHDDENMKNTEQNEDGDKNGGKNNKNEVKPSEIAIHPNGDVYVLDGPRSELFIADTTGKIKSSYQLDKKIFPQPEGMCFGPSGDLFISSEGGKNGKGVIARVDLNESLGAR
jgi:hypothetical protein